MNTLAENTLTRTITSLEIEFNNLSSLKHNLIIEKKYDLANRVNQTLIDVLHLHKSIISDLHFIAENKELSYDDNRKKNTFLEDLPD